jgi:NTE family protein
MLTLSTTGGPVDLVLHGGGIKAIGLVGALSALEENGFRPRRVGGSSAGAIVAGLIAAGYTAGELREIIETEDFPIYLDRRWYARLPGVGRPFALLWRMGLYAGDRLLDRLRELLGDRELRTFTDLQVASHESRIDDALRVVVSDVTARRIVVLPRDATRFGIAPEDLDIALALRMSASIPIIYEPVRLKNLEDGEQHLLVDGGMLSNFPLWLFDAAQEPEVPVIGLRLMDDHPSTSLAERLPIPALARTRVGQFIDYVESLARTMMEAHDRRYLESDEAARTIDIPSLGISATQFDITPAQIEALYQSGREAVLRALDRDGD